MATPMLVDNYTHVRRLLKAIDWGCDAKYISFLGPVYEFTYLLTYLLTAKGGLLVCMAWHSRRSANKRATAQ